MNEKAILLDNDLLVAYVDGELPPERARAVDAALVQDADAWETVRLLRLSAGAAVRAFTPVLEEPVPARLIEAASRAATAMPLRPARRGWAAALAASLIALAIGLGAGYALHGNRGYVPASLPDADPLAGRFEATLLAALDKGSDGASFTYAVEGAGQGEIRLGRAFTTGFGTDCREFQRLESRPDGKHNANGVACRAADKSWTVMILPGGS